MTGMPNNIRQHETVIEVTYLYQITPWWSLQPDLQGVFNPGAALASSLQIPPRKPSLAVVRARRSTSDHSRFLPRYSNQSNIRRSTTSALYRRGNSLGALPTFPQSG